MTESTDLLPLYDSSRGFHTALRGYDREQVDREITRLDEDLRVIAAERDAAVGRSANLAAQLASTQAQMESLRRQLRAASETITADNLDGRVQQILGDAQNQAAALRAAAQAESEQLRQNAAENAARVRAEAQAAADRLLAEAAAERARLDAEGQARRKLADDDFEIALHVRRTRALEEHAAQQAEAQARAERTIAGAEARAAQLVAEATAEVQRLQTAQQAARADLEALERRIREALQQP